MKEVSNCFNTVYHLANILRSLYAEMLSIVAKNIGGQQPILLATVVKSSYGS